MRFGQLNLSPLWSSAGGVANFLLLYWPMGLFFTGRTSPSGLYYFFALRLPPPFRVRLFSPRRRGWLRGTVRRFRGGRRKFRLGRPLNLPPYWLTLQQLLKTALGFPLDAYVLRCVR